MRIPLFLLAAVAGAMLVAGCGSSNGNLSYSDFGTQANQICKDGKAALANVKSAPEFATTVQPFIDKIKDLKAPDELRSAQADFVSISEQQVAAAKANDIPKVQSLEPASDAAGSKMGAPDCASTD